MVEQRWCEHDEKTSKFTMLDYQFEDKTVKLRVQSWFCPICGMHGAETQVISPMPFPKRIEQNAYSLCWVEP
ncbi:hypothetical protein [Dendrosporobacter sp. 1207_IL3150]|uniref:hypothetical protein n=1 Tax=Dendrosporobacter sp. 1207_IL3150 TaxID=3084054 RepID=UPI002FD93B54